MHRWGKEPQHPSLDIPDRLPGDFVPTAPEGLTQAEAARRTKAGLDNQPPKSSGRSAPEVIARHLFTLFNLLNAALAVALAAVGAYRNMLFLGVVVSNTLIGTVQELRAQATIRRLQLQSSAPVHVLREGSEQALPTQQLVQGDLVRLHPGDQVPADAVVASGHGTADESLLTGESRPVEKAVGSWLMSGSFIVSGSFTAQLVHVGQHSYLSRLTAAAKTVRQPRSQLLSDLKKLVRYLTMVLIPLGLLLFYRQWQVLGQPLERAVPSAVAAMIGMIPEGLMLLTSMALTVGVIRLGKRDTLVSELYGIENLARVDTLCLDKTGTLTTGDMHVERFRPIAADEADLRAAFSRYLSAFEADSPTLKALALACPPTGEQASLLVPFSSDKKYSAATFSHGETLILGAPSFILREDTPAEVLRLVENASQEGWRVLALMRAGHPVTAGALPPDRQLLGLALLGDTLRPHLAETLRYFQEQGVALKIISGDDPRTVSAIAKRAGVPGAERFVDTAALTDDQLAAACRDTVVFGRVTPDRKRRLVDLLKAAGRTVAMTGDGVNDIPAMKAADCSIAMGNGSDAARKTAQITLLHSDFAALPQVVAEGRRVINNITRAASLFLIKTLYSFALSLVLLFVHAAYPFQPIQLTLISSLSIGIPTFFLAFEPNRERVQGHFLRRVIFGAIPAAVGVTACALVAMSLEHAGWDAALCSTLATLSALGVGLLALFRNCLPPTRLRMAVFGLMMAAAVAMVLALPGVFYLQRLQGMEYAAYAALLAGGCGVTLGVDYLLKRRQGEQV